MRSTGPHHQPGNPRLMMRSAGEWRRRVALGWHRVIRRRQCGVRCGTIVDPSGGQSFWRSRHVAAAGRRHRRRHLRARSWTWSPSGPCRHRLCHLHGGCPSGPSRHGLCHLHGGPSRPGWPMLSCRICSRLHFSRPFSAQLGPLGPRRPRTRRRVGPECALPKLIPAMEEFSNSRGHGVLAEPLCRFSRYGMESFEISLAMAGMLFLWHVVLQIQSPVWRGD